jgi:hypothetical protein
VTKGTEPPPSVYPKLADHTLVANTSIAMGAPSIPGTPPPDGLQFPLLNYDVGAGFDYLNQSGVAQKVPTVIQVLPQVVPAVDRDGNELVGLKSPLLQNPLGTYLGYNTFAGGFQKGQTCIQNAPAGGYVAFAETKEARLATNDPRPSLEERYGTRENWLEGVRAAANELVAQRYLVKADADAMIAQAEASSILKARPTVPTETVVEYYWAGKDQYFYTSNAAEIASLDASSNWKRTGQSFKAFVSGSSKGQGTAVCRNYSETGMAAGAHLFSVSASECASYTNAPLSDSWVRESASAFEMALPYSVTGACPKNTVPVYRVDNNRPDINARYTTSVATREAMLGAGKVKGGFGPTGVGMCSPV